MAKKATIERELKREKLVQKFEAKRAGIKDKLKSLYNKLNDPNEDVDSILAEIEVAQNKIDSLPRNSSKKRKRNRCKLTGRPRGTYRHFKLSRNMLRKFAMMGLIPGIRKSSW